MNLNPSNNNQFKRASCLETIKRLINQQIISKEARLRSATESRLLRLNEAEMPLDTKNHVEEFQTEV